MQILDGRVKSEVPLRPTAFAVPVEDRYFEDCLRGPIFEHGRISTTDAEMVEFARRFELTRHACRPRPPRWKRFASSARRPWVEISSSTVFAHVFVEQVATSSANGTAMLDVSSGPVFASILRNVGGTEKISVPTLSLTSFAERVYLRRLDLIKMDIESAEYDAHVGAGVIIS